MKYVTANTNLSLLAVNKENIDSYTIYSLIITLYRDVIFPGFVRLCRHQTNRSSHVTIDMRQYIRFSCYNRYETVLCAL